MIKKRFFFGREPSRELRSRVFNHLTTLSSPKKISPINDVVKDGCGKLLFGETGTTRQRPFF